MRRMSLPLIFVDSYDLAEAFTYRGHVLKLPREIFLATQSLTLHSPTLLFWPQRVKIEL